MALHGLGRDKEADAALQALVDKFGPDQPEYVATAHAYRGLADAAFEWLDKADAIHDPGVASVLSDPVFDALHSDRTGCPTCARSVARRSSSRRSISCALPTLAEGNPAAGRRIRSCTASRAGTNGGALRTLATDRNGSD